MGLFGNYIVSTLISEKYPVSRKDRPCMACETLSYWGIRAKDFTFAERRQLAIARRNGWRIKTGEKYLKQFIVCCGDAGTFQAIPAMHNLCLKYDMYEDAC